MKIKHQMILCKLRPKNIACNNEIVRIKRKVTYHAYLILLLCMFSPAKFLCAQTDLPKKEEENLNVFHDWIKWNNPGSLVLNHLNKQAEVYYKIRDDEIAKLKT